MKKKSVEQILAQALYQFSYGRLSIEDAEKTAKLYAPKLESDPSALEHKSVVFYARQILQSM